MNEDLIVDIMTVGIIALMLGGPVYLVMLPYRRERKYNNSQPIITVPGFVLTKRSLVKGRHTETFYYITFESNDKERFEVRVKGEVWGSMVEGEHGQITYQGKRLIEFKREC